MSYIISPQTGRKIKIGGETHQKLLKSPYWKNKLPEHSSKGCTNQGKYKNVPQELFCGPEGGRCPGTFPVNTPQRARVALSYSRYAPNPEGIKECVKRISKSKGWKK